jgi:8-oxo-dGTP pyrophosphatase MutT (NUDIX family)
MIDPSDRVLLVRLRFDDWTGWVLPGGGKEPGEDDATALRRELTEETGVPQVFQGPLLWHRRIINPDMSANYDGQEEHVYLVPCREFEIAPTMTVEELAEEGLVEHRWWTVDELAATDDTLRPSDLAQVLSDVLEHGAPPEPWSFED